jgi:hypothetical protein
LKLRTIPLLALPLAAFGLAPQVQAPAFRIADGRNTPEERLETMREMMKIYTISREGDAPAPFKLQAEPAFRLGRQGGNVLDGAVYLFTDEAVGRPEAAIQAFLEKSSKYPDGKWVHEFTSLSTAPLVARKDGNPKWQPASSGLEFRAIPDAPRPASTAPARLRQMRAIADEFVADDDFGGMKKYHRLRMLTTPIARYGKPGGTVEDGALFAFVEGTDPEVFLFVESRKGSDGQEWQYGLAPMGCWAVKAQHKGREVWNLPRRPTDQPANPLYSYRFWPRTELDPP